MLPSVTVIVRFWSSMAMDRGLYRRILIKEQWLIRQVVEVERGCQGAE